MVLQVDKHQYLMIAILYVSINKQYLDMKVKLVRAIPNVEIKVIISLEYTKSTKDTGYLYAVVVTQKI